MKNKIKILNKLETRARTVSCARKIMKKNNIDPLILNKYWLGDFEPMGTKKFFYTKKSEEEFKKFIISNRDYELEIKTNLKKREKIKTLNSNERLRTCTKCKTEFVTTIDKFGVSYNTRCKKCKTLERSDKTGKLNGRLGKVN
ncbi:MAG: hypothetical protein WBG30_08850 [Psychrilyobacter sp.]|uniref:hypothetical protein n=1 Tax=Psychrilyobacter sp. TaxID=2586924 RepID=UPI003C74C037